MKIAGNSFHVVVENTTESAKMVWREDEDGVIIWKPRLVFYEKEHKIYSEAYNKQLSGKRLDFVFKKLNRHYKLNLVIEHKGRTTGHFKSSYLRRQSWIEVPDDCGFGLLCHEIAHAIDKRKRGKSKHDKRFMKLIGRVINYCKKKNWWENNPSLLFQEPSESGSVSVQLN